MKTALLLLLIQFSPTFLQRTCAKVSNLHSGLDYSVGIRYTLIQIWYLVVLVLRHAVLKLSHLRPFVFKFYVRVQRLFVSEAMFSEISKAM